MGILIIIGIVLAVLFVVACIDVLFYKQKTGEHEGRSMPFRFGDPDKFYKDEMKYLEDNNLL